MKPSVVDLPWLCPPPPDFTAACRAITPDNFDGAGIQQLSNHRLNQRQCAALSRAINRCRPLVPDTAPLSRFKLGLLTNATFDLVTECLPASCARHGVALEVLGARFDQVVQQALDPKSEINSSRPDAVLLAVDHRWLNIDRARLEGGCGDAMRSAVDNLRQVVQGIRDHAGCAVILQTLADPPMDLFGSLDVRIQGTVRSMIGELNSRIVELAGETGGYLLDVASLAAQIGTDRWFDAPQWLSYKLPFSADCFPVYADKVGRLLGSIRGKSRKCLVLDLDNTIWGGIVGDEGPAGIRIGQGNALGEAYLSVQQMAIDLRTRGVILAVCSKNDEENARQPFREREDMLLGEDDFAVFQANWDDKPGNLRAIAKALNIGLDALVLLDDNPAERHLVRTVLPDVAVPELPSDPSLYPWYLAAAGYFESVAYSADDRLRAESYAADAHRARTRMAAGDLWGYLVSLDMAAAFSRFNEKNRPRITQLINKTNQFNLTTRRYTEPQIAELEKDDSVLTLNVRLKDRFGDLGIIGALICRGSASEPDTWEIDTWLISCRAFGRHVERAMLMQLAEEARTRGIRRLMGVYIPTAKNAIVADHYPQLGFESADDAAPAGTRWKLDLSRYTPPDLPMRIVSEAGE